MHVKSITFWLHQPLNLISNDTTGHCLTFATPLCESVTNSVTNRQPTLIKAQQGSCKLCKTNYICMRWKWNQHVISHLCGLCARCCFKYVCLSITFVSLSQATLRRPEDPWDPLYILPFCLINFDKNAKNTPFPLVCCRQKCQTNKELYFVRFPFICVFSWRYSFRSCQCRMWDHSSKNRRKKTEGWKDENFDSSLLF